MKQVRIVLAVLFVGGLLPSSEGHTRVTIVGVPCGGHIPAVCQAGEIRDPEERERELYRTLTDALQASQQVIREEAFSYLVDVGRPPKELGLQPLDPRPLRQALEKFDELANDDQGRSWLEEWAFKFATRRERVDLYQRAIAEGEAAFEKHYRVVRQNAMERAAREGMTELRTLIERFCPDETTSGCSELAYYLASLELREGGVDQADADAHAVERIAALPSEELWRRLSTAGLSWGRAISDVYSGVCATEGRGSCQDLRVALRRARPFAEAACNRLKSERLRAWDHAKSPNPDPPSKEEERLSNLLAFLSSD